MRISHVLSLALLLTSVRAEATKIIHWPYAYWVWSHNAASCVPDSATIASNSYEALGGYVHTTSHSTAVIYCPVSTLFTNEEEPFYSDLNIGEAVVVHISYKGLRDDVNAHSYTMVQLIRRNKSSDTETVLTDAYLPSASSVTSSAINPIMPTYSDWSESQYFYYIKVYLQPSLTLNGYDQTVYTVWLQLGAP